MTKFYSPKGLSVYQRDNGVVIAGIFVFLDGRRSSLGRMESTQSGPWESDHDAFSHLTPENLIEWSEEE